MKQPFWKRWLSHLIPFTIETTEGVHNPYLEVIYKKGRYQLNTEHAIYSYEDLYTNFYQTFEQIDLPAKKVKNVLILGLGLGSIPVMLEQNFNQQYHITGVEIDEEVIFLANKYALTYLNSPMEIVCADAYHYVRQCNQKFDLICMDVFIDDVIPHEFEQQDFLSYIKELLTENGTLLYNRLAYTDTDQIASKQFFDSQFLPVFPKGKYLNLDDNWMVMNR